MTSNLEAELSAAREKLAYLERRAAGLDQPGGILSPSPLAETVERRQKRLAELEKGRGSPETLAYTRQAVGAALAEYEDSPTAALEALPAARTRVNRLEQAIKQAERENIRPEYQALVNELAEALQAAAAVNDRLVALRKKRGFIVNNWPRPWSELSPVGIAEIFHKPTQLDNWLKDGRKRGFID